MHLTATLVVSAASHPEVWLIGGSDDSDKFSDVHVFDLQRRQFRTPHLHGDTGLLGRTAHAAALHPCDPRTILVYGGYDPPTGASAEHGWLGDLVALNTVSGRGGARCPPGHHAAAAAGS